MEIKSTLNVFNQSEITGVPGVVPQGQLVKQLVGNAEHPTERLLARRQAISFKKSLY